MSEKFDINVSVSSSMVCVVGFVSFLLSSTKTSCAGVAELFDIAIFAASNSVSF